MATPPRSCALNDANAPESLPIGVRAVETITEPGMATPVGSVPVWLPGGKGANRSPRFARFVQTSRASPAHGDRARRTATFPPMTTEIDAIRAAVLEGAPGDELASLPLPEGVRGALVRADEQEMFAGLPSEEKDPGKSTHVEDFPFPEIAPD